MADSDSDDNAASSVASDASAAALAPALYLRMLNQVLKDLVENEDSFDGEDYAKVIASFLRLMGFGVSPSGQMRKDESELKEVLLSVYDNIGTDPGVLGKLNDYGMTLHPRNILDMCSDRVRRDCSEVAGGRWLNIIAEYLEQGVIDARSELFQVALSEFLQECSLSDEKSLAVIVRCVSRCNSKRQCGKFIAAVANYMEFIRAGKESGEYEMTCTFLTAFIMEGFWQELSGNMRHFTAQFEDWVADDDDIHSILIEYMKETLGLNLDGNGDIIDEDDDGHGNLEGFVVDSDESSKVEEDDADEEMIDVDASDNDDEERGEDGVIDVDNEYNDEEDEEEEGDDSDADSDEDENENEGSDRKRRKLVDDEAIEGADTDSGAGSSDNLEDTDDEV